MTQRTINLYDGLEALYYFDSDYFDGTTGEIKDKSGHGRHAKAFGGPTVGVNGPNDFEAAALSGGNSGDEFLKSNGLENPVGDFTLTYLVSSKNIDFLGSNFNNTGFPLLHVRELESTFTATFSDGGGNTTEVGRNQGPIIADGNPHLCNVVRKGDTARTIVDGKVTEKISGLGFNVSSRGPWTIMSGGGERFSGGKLSVFAEHSRALTEAEIQALNGLTAPRRSML